jgi:hypothetical protein
MHRGPAPAAVPDAFPAGGGRRGPAHVDPARVHRRLELSLLAFRGFFFAVIREADGQAIAQRQVLAQGVAHQRGGPRGLGHAAVHTELIYITLNML